MRSFLGVSFIWICLIACGGGLDINSNAGNVCSEIAKVACHNLYQCCSEGEIENRLGVDEPRTEPQCQEDVRRLCDRSVARLDEGITAKRVRFDDNLMNSCLQALVAPDSACATVETTLPWAEECMNSAWVGLVADGGQCFGSLECASKDSFCAPNQTCIARPTSGQPCGAAGCATGFFCQGATCAPQLGVGQTCAAEIQCQDPLFCDFASLSGPKCAEVLEAGASCTSSNACKSRQCIPGACAVSGQACFTDATCGRRCTNTGTTCFQDSTCGNGTCSVTTTMTCNNTTLLCPTGELCQFAPLCQQSECIGDPVCTQAQIVVDYCEDTFNDLPFPNN
jgi:hypothetical protein